MSEQHYEPETTEQDRAEVAAMHASMPEGPHELGVIELKRPEQLMALHHMAMDTKHTFDEDVAALFAAHPEYPAQVRRWRIDEGASWRSVAWQANEEWAEALAAAGIAPWQSNQLAGMALCEAAAEAEGADYMEPPWNG